tara:strand:- start:97 stop:804 length:708 start_codon:yes stop_codon:yes gene_type:complete
MIPIDINAVTVCVNYSHYLKYCISNKRFFKRWVIVTHEDDKDTIKLCKKHNLEYILSQEIYKRTFNKGAAINEGINYIGQDQEWFCHIDADVLLQDNFASTFNSTHINGKLRHTYLERVLPHQHELGTMPDALYLYTMGRINLNGDENLDEINFKETFKMENKITQQWLGWGYFQLFNLKALKEVYENLYQVYPTMSNNAGTDDYVFKQLFYQVISLNTHCVHLSPEKIHWDGIG